MTRGNPELPYVYKHLVIVHGIGEQVPNETSLGFMNQFLRALPRGPGYSLEVDNLIKTVDPPQGATQGSPEQAFRPAYAVFTVQDGAGAGLNYVIGFSEVYWQDITRKVLGQFDGAPPVPIYVWAHSINTRLLRDSRQRSAERNHYRLPPSERRFYTARDAIDNLESILTLVKYLALIFKKPKEFLDILNHFLGDVQMYAESDVIRGRINQRFKDVLAETQFAALDVGQQLQQTFDKPQVYVVAHSEGTVVSYNSLVEAAATSEPWFDSVKGLVTLGCPIDKHYTIWKNRFLTETVGLRERPYDDRIPWFNYWDVSDPVGYGLKVLRPEEPGSDANKLFRVGYDSGFARYPIPGAAHVAYWTDKAIHEDIISRVLGLGTTRADTTVRSRWFEHIQSLSDWAAYLLVRAIALAALFFFLTRLLGGLKALSGFGDTPAVGVPVVVAFLLASKLAWEWYAHTTGVLARAGRIVRVLSGVAWIGLFVLAALHSAGSRSLDVKDVTGYGTGLIASVLLWKLHTHVHKGIIQMWRYTKGNRPDADTRARAVELPPPVDERLRRAARAGT